jgi:hypothetical protein
MPNAASGLTLFGITQVVDRLLFEHNKELSDAIKGRNF